MTTQLNLRMSLVLDIQSHSYFPEKRETKTCKKSKQEELIPFEYDL